MTQDERWAYMYRRYMRYLEVNKRCPSKYKVRDSKLVNWVKHNRKLRNKGLLKDSRKERFFHLLEVAEKYKRVNQHKYADGESGEA